MTVTAVATRSSADLKLERDELTNGIEAARKRLEEVRLEHKTRRSELRRADAAAVHAGKGATDPAADKSAAELTRLDRAVGAQEQALQEDEERAAALQREHDLAVGRESVEQERGLLERTPTVALRLLEACVQVAIARAAEYGHDIALFETRKELDRIADQTGESSFRRRVFVFHGSYRPELDHLGNLVEKLCKELDVKVDEAGRISPRQR